MLVSFFVVIRSCRAFGAVLSESGSVGKSTNYEGDAMKVITSFSGAKYFLIGQESDWNLLKSTAFNQFVVAYKIYEIEAGIYDWQEGFCFNADIYGACDCFTNKVLPFEK
jgi:hypothetical protein